MSTPLVNKTTISSRNKVAQTNNNGTLSSSQSTIKPKSGLQPPSQIARNRANFRTPAPPSAAAQRIANLANGLPVSLTKAAQSTAIKETNHLNNNNNNNAPILPAPKTSSISRITSSTRLPATNGTTKLPPCTTAKIDRIYSRTTGTIGPTAATASRIQLPRSRLATDTNNFVDSRSSSVVSSLSSINAASKRSVASSSQLSNKQPSSALNNVPQTNVVRKGLAKFANPIECQRQFQSLNTKIRQLTEVNEAKEKEINQLREQLQFSTDYGVGYATVVQYFAKKLKLDCDINLTTECDQLKARINELVIKERQSEERLESIVDNYKEHLRNEIDLKRSLEREIEDLRKTHANELKKLENLHKQEIDINEERHASIQSDLEDRITNLSSELDSKCKELNDLRKGYDNLETNYNKLEESLTKDKDARVKFFQDKVVQLQKDVDSLNSVLEMRLEKLHILEKDSILLGEAQNELTSAKDQNKALKQQLESMEAALERKRELYENLVVEHDRVVQDLKRERMVSRRMTMKTEQLEFVLNESCVSESNIQLLNSSARDLDSSDQVL